MSFERGGLFGSRIALIANGFIVTVLRGLARLHLRDEIGEGLLLAFVELCDLGGINRGDVDRAERVVNF